MAQGRIEDNIYYDNMEMMEQIEKSRNKTRLPGKSAKKKITSVDQGKIGQEAEKPPALPPKKKNMQKPSQKQPDKKVDNKMTEIEKNLDPKPLPEKIVENDQQPMMKTWTHPGILRTRSIVDEPLSPILEEESVMGDSQQGSPECSENESCDRRSLTASDVFQSDSSVFYETCGDSVSKNENSSGEHSDKISVHSQHSEDSKSLNSSRNVMAVKELSTKEEKFYSVSESSNSGSNFSNSRNFSHTSESPSSQHDSEDTVEPYGMVDLAHLEKAPEMKTNALSPNKRHPRKSPRKSPNENVEKGISQFRPPVMYDETVVYDNIDDYNGTHSTAVSSLDKRGVSTANQSASPKPRSKHSPRNSLAQKQRENEERISNGKQISSKNRHHVPAGTQKINKASINNTNSTTDISLPTQKTDKKTKRNQDLPLPPKPPITKPRVFSQVQDVKDFYKDDVNMYEEIHPRIDSSQTSNQQNDEMEKALNDIQEILESMDIPDVFGVQSQTLSAKKFPVAKEDRTYEPPQYDNFSSMITENLSKRQEKRHFASANQQGNVSTNNAIQSDGIVARHLLGESEKPYFERNDMTKSTPKSQLDRNPSFGINRGVAPGHVKSNPSSYQTLNPTDIDSTRESTAPTQILKTNKNSPIEFNMPRANNLKTSKSSSDFSTEENGKGIIPTSQSTESYRKSRSLDDSEKAILTNIDDDSTSRRTKSRESDGDSGMYSQNVGDFTDEGLTMRSGSQYSDESMLDTSESLKGSTRSLGRLNSRERKKSPLRSKFKFRVRSKSQDRLPSDAQAQQSGNSDVDEESKSRRRKGSRLSRRISRKTAERRGRSADRKSGDEDTGGESRGHNPVNFIRKLLRKSREPPNENPQTFRKTDLPSPDSKQDKQTSDSSSTPMQQSYQQEDPPREKQLISPPSRRARKMLHSRRTRDYVSSSDEDVTAVHQSRESYDTKGSKYAPHRHCVTPDSASFRNRRRNTPGHNNPPSSSDSEGEPCVVSDIKDRAGSFNDRRKNNSRTLENTRPHRAQHGRRRSEKRRLHSDSTFPNTSASQQQEKYKTLVSLNAQTLKKITEKWLTEWRNQLPVGGFLITSWSDVVLASKRPQCVLGKSVIYVAHFSTNPDHKLACQIFHQRDVNSRLVRQLENCSTLTAHPNLCSVCSHFPCQIPGSLLNPSLGDRPMNALCVVLANVPAMSLADYIRRLAEEKEQKQVHKQILLMLLQLLQALDNLSSSGFRLANLRPEHLVVTQERGLLQILPHMDCGDEQDSLQTFSNHSESQETLPIIQQIARLVTWMLDVGVNIHTVPLKQPQIESPHLFALQKVVYILTEPNFSADSRSVQNLAQCAIWGPMTSDEIDFTYKNTYDALEMWIDVKQAKLVTSIAVLFSGKSNSVPIYMFYKHQYFSQVNPESLYQNLKILELI